MITPSPAPTERLTGQLRWLRTVSTTTKPDILQQEWEDLLTYTKTWRDVQITLTPS